MAKSVTTKWSGAAAGKSIHDGAARGLAMWAEHVLTGSNAGVPLDEGPLMHSGVASSDPASLTAAVSYDTPYAVRQHEDMQARHAPGRHAKFLELALNDSIKIGPAIVAAQIRRATR